MKFNDRELWYLIARDNAPTIWEEALRATSATVEDSEPPNNFGFLKEPHDELYPCAWIGTRMRDDARKAILDHVNSALAQNGYPDAGSFINYSVYGSGASYNWDEDGDFDMQMWVDVDKYNEGRDKEDLMTEDDLVADIRRIVQLVNFPSFKELGLANEKSEGKMLIQYYAKPGTGSKEENLASKPYACFDLELDKWYQKPKPITPEFYGEWFILLEPKAKDIAMQASAVLESLERNVVEWSFWSQMYEKHSDPRFKAQADQARDDAEQDKEGAHNLFLNVFQGRAKAYSPEGEGANDERDLLEKLLEVWGIFQRLRHAVKEALPWEEQELPEEPLPIEDHETDADEDSDSHKNHSHWHIVVGDVEDKLAETVHAISSQGGGTWTLNLDPVHFTDGYYASVAGYEQQVPIDQFGEDTLKAYLDVVRGHPNKLLGAWVEEGTVYLDLSKHIPDRSTAIEFGVYNNQRAIWDIAADKAIVLDHEDFEPSPAFSKVAAWKDLMEKAKRLKDQGRVHILNNEADHVVGRVEGDHGTYTTQIWRQDPNSRAITMWDCECPWDQYAWQRTRQWKKYEGRPCSHTLALFWEAQANAAQQPQVSPDQMQLPGMPAPTAPPPVPYQPGQPNLEGQGLPRPGQEPVLPRGPWEPTPQTPLQTPPGTPPVAPGAPAIGQPAPGMQIDPRVLRTAPGQQQVDPRFAPPAQPGGNSQPQEPGEGGNFGFPGALSNWRYSMADRSGVPEVDALIEEFLQTPMGEWTTDNDPIDALRDPERAHGVCQMVTEQFVEFAKSKGFKAYETNTDVDEMGYTPTGQGGEIGFNENDEMQYGFYPEHTVATIVIDDPNYHWGREIYVDFTASQYGYSDHPKVTKWKLANFENGTIVRAEQPLIGIDRDGREWRVPRNSKGEVLSSDELETIAIFPLSGGNLTPHLVRVRANPSAFSQSHGSPFIG